MKRRTWLLAALSLAQEGAVTIVAPFTSGTGLDILAWLAASL